MTASSWKSGRLRELDPSECLELLATRSVGRVAFCTDEGPVARYVSGHQAAFEVDEVDDFTQSGWSVLMRGTAELVEDVHDIPTESRPVPWAEGTRSLFVRVRTRTITGRRLFPT